MRLLASLSAWVGHALSGRWQLDDEVWRPDDSLPVARMLFAAAQKCHRFVYGADNLYRMGALACILNDEDRAVICFREAAQLQTPPDTWDAIGAKVLAERALNDWKGSIGNEQMQALGRFAAYAAWAIHKGRARAIREDMKKFNNQIEIWQGVRGETAAFDAISELIADALAEPPEPVESQRAADEGGKH